MFNLNQQCDCFLMAYGVSSETEKRDYDGELTMREITSECDTSRVLTIQPDDVNLRNILCADSFILSICQSSAVRYVRNTSTVHEYIAQSKYAKFYCSC